MNTAVATPQALAKAGATQTTALVSRLVSQFGATWVDESSVAFWTQQPGDHVLLLAGDAVRFPEGQDVAAVLPELMRAFPDRFNVAVVPRASEDAVARRFGSQRWPTLLFFRDGHYVTAIAGMQDWDVYLQGVAQALQMPPSRAPTIGIPVVTAGASSTACH